MLYNIINVILYVVLYIVHMLSCFWSGIDPGSSSMRQSSGRMSCRLWPRNQTSTWENAPLHSDAAATCTIPDITPDCYYLHYP